MLLVKVIASTDNNCNTYAREVAKDLLPGSVSKHLSFLDHEVSPDSVVIRVKQKGMNDVNMPDILIIIEAPEFPELVKKENEISRAIKQAVDKFLAKRSKPPTVFVATKLIKMGSAG